MPVQKRKPQRGDSRSHHCRSVGALIVAARTTPGAYAPGYPLSPQCGSPARVHTHHHHCGGGVYGTSAGGGLPYVTGAVAHGSHTGAGGGQAGGQAAMGAGFGQHQLQQPQPALLTANTPRLSAINILFIASVSLQETNPSTVLRGRSVAGSHASVRRSSKHRSATEPYPARWDVQPKPR